LPSGSVLEIGSGAGNDASSLLEMGYDYTGTDASSGLIEVARKRNPQATFINVNADELNFPEKSFDGFWAAAVLLHIPKENIDNVLQSIKKQVREGGIGFISLKEGEGEEEDKKTGRWFSYYKEDEFKEVLLRNGFETVEVENKTENREGRPDWLAFLVRVQ
jgi:ubiquinone/menaquinone biosynthesis C-methylase UbiE